MKKIIALALALILLLCACGGPAEISFTVEEGSVTPYGLTYVLEVSGGKTEFMTYGYTLEKGSGDSWTELKVRKPNADKGTNMSGGGVNATIGVSWEDRYGALAAGNYRICLPVTTGGTEQVYYAEFTVE